MASNSSASDSTDIFSSLERRLRLGKVKEWADVLLGSSFYSCAVSLSRSNLAVMMHAERRRES